MSGMSEEKEEVAEAAEAETATAMTSELIVGGRDLELLEEGRPLNGILVEVGIHKVMRGEDKLPLQSRKNASSFGTLCGSGSVGRKLEVSTERAEGRKGLRIDCTCEKYAFAPFLLLKRDDIFCSSSFLRKGTTAERPRKPPHLPRRRTEPSEAKTPIFLAQERVRGEMERGF